MLIDKVIELDNGINYYIIEEMDVKDRKFVLCKMEKKKKDTVNSEDLIVKELISINDGVTTADIPDLKEAEAITKLLLEKVHMNV